MAIKILENIVTVSILVFKVIIAYLETIISLFPVKTNKSIENQNVLITGAGHGFGRELALGFAKRGANLILIDINKTNNAAVKEEVQSKNNSVRVLDFCLDITDNDKIAQVAEQIKLDFVSIPSKQGQLISHTVICFILTDIFSINRVMLTF